MLKPRIRASRPKPGELYVGRLPQILRGVANIKFAVQEMQKVEAPRCRTSGRRRAMHPQQPLFGASKRQAGPARLFFTPAGVRACGIVALLCDEDFRLRLSRHRAGWLCVVEKQDFEGN